MALQVKVPANYLPAGGNVKHNLDQSCKWAQGKAQVLPYYLSPGKIDASIRTNAGLSKPFDSVLAASRECAVIQFSTGCYYTVCVTLVREWLGMIGEATTWMDGQTSLKVEGVWVQEDKAGAAQTYQVKLLVEGAALTIHFYNTKHKINIQGKSEPLNKFMEEVFTPFLERESSRCAPEIKTINDMMVLGKRGEKRNLDPTTSKTNHTPKYKKVIQTCADSDSEMEFDSESDTEAVDIPQSDQQLSESVLLHSTLHPSEYLGTPPSYPCRLEIDQIPAQGMESENLKKTVDGLEEDIISARRMNMDAQLFMHSLSKSLPKELLGGMLNQYYVNLESVTTSHNEVTNNINVVDLAQAITVRDSAQANIVKDLAQANVEKDSAQANIVKDLAQANNLEDLAPDNTAANGEEVQLASMTDEWQLTGEPETPAGRSGGHGGGLVPTPAPHQVVESAIHGGGLPTTATAATAMATTATRQLAGCGQGTTTASTKAIDSLQTGGGLGATAVSSQGMANQQLPGGLVTALDPSASPWQPPCNDHLQASTQSTHPEGRSKPKHQCDLCEHGENMILNLWRHKAIEHGEGYDEDFLLYILTEQNYELLEKIKKLEEVTSKNNSEVQKAMTAMVKEDITMGDIVDNQAELIIDNLKVNRKIDNLVTGYNPSTVQCSNPAYFGWGHR